MVGTLSRLATAACGATCANRDRCYPACYNGAAHTPRRYAQIVYAHMTLKSRQIKMHDTCAPREAIAPPSAHTAAQMCPHPHTLQPRCAPIRTHLSPDVFPSAHTSAQICSLPHTRQHIHPSAHTSTQMCSLPHTPQFRCAPFRTHLSPDVLLSAHTAAQIPFRTHRSQDVLHSTRSGRC